MTEHALSTLCRHALNREPSQQIIEFDKRWFTWGELRHVAERLGNVLTASGIPRGAPVALLSRNRPSAVAALLGLIANGYTIRMIYAFQSAAGKARDVERLKPAAVVAGAQEFSPEVLEVMRAQGIAGVALAEMDASAGAGRERVHRTDIEIPADARIEILTSGTTGPPKQFVVTFDLIAKHHVGTDLMQPNAGSDRSHLPPILLYPPLGNISGVYSIIPATLNNQRIVLVDKFTVAGWHEYVVRHRPQTCGLPPPSVQSVLDANIPRDDLSSIRMLGVGAAPLDPTVQRAFEDHYGIPILVSYGATEFAGPVAAMTLELHGQWGKQKLGTVGRAMPGAQLRVVDPASGEVLPPGTEGLLEVITPRIGSNWIRTSDVALIDADGFLFLRGRADGAIMRGGFKLLPETIERALLLHPAVSAAAVVGIPDHRLGQVPGATVQFKPDAVQPTIAELEAHLRQQVLATHIPTAWKFVAELPKNASMKIDKLAVRRLFENADAVARREHA